MSRDSYDQLKDLIASVSPSPQEKPAWETVCRVRDYVGAEAWARARDQSGNDYDLATHVLLHLSGVDAARADVAPYLEVSCAHHDAASGTPCLLDDGAWYHEVVPLPKEARVCTRRVIAVHGRAALLPLFERETTTARGRREVLPLGAILANDDSRVRVQYRNPTELQAERFYITGARDWVIQDVRIAERTILGGHRDLPGFLFSNRVVGPHLPLPVIEQDQWIEIDARRVRGEVGRFHAVLVGTTKRQ